MRIELLYFESCRGSAMTAGILESAVTEEGIAAEIMTTPLGADDRRVFPGSPTVLVDGEDLFPAQRRDESRALSCRIYSSPEGPKDHPTEAMVRAALRERSR